MTELLSVSVRQSLKMTWAGPLQQISEVCNQGVSWAAFHLETNLRALLPNSFGFWHKFFPQWHSPRAFLLVLTRGYSRFLFCRQSTWTACFLMTHGAGFHSSVLGSAWTSCHHVSHIAACFSYCLWEPYIRSPPHSGTEDLFEGVIL
jgi:hypothetical protein